jgi:hypothetical protein
MAEYLEVPVKMLRLPKYSADGFTQKRRGIFTGGSEWR